MGADIWVGRPGHSLGYFRDSYTGAITLNAIGLSYWQDLAPRLINGELWPLEENEALAELIRQSAAITLDGPNALQYARHYLEQAQLPEADPGEMITYWRAHIGHLLELIELSTAKQVPLVMSL